MRFYEINYLQNGGKPLDVFYYRLLSFLDGKENELYGPKVAIEIINSFNGMEIGGYKLENKNIDEYYDDDDQYIDEGIIRIPDNNIISDNEIVNDRIINVLVEKFTNTLIPKDKKNLRRNIEYSLLPLIELKKQILKEVKEQLDYNRKQDINLNQLFYIDQKQEDYTQHKLIRTRSAPVTKEEKNHVEKLELKRKIRDLNTNLINEVIKQFNLRLIKLFDIIYDDDLRIIEKNFYENKKFSEILRSIPDIRKIRSEYQSGLVLNELVKFINNIINIDPIMSKILYKQIYVDKQIEQDLFPNDAYSNKKYQEIRILYDHTMGTISNTIPKNNLVNYRKIVFNKTLEENEKELKENFKKDIFLLKYDNFVSTDDYTWLYTEDLQLNRNFSSYNIIKESINKSLLNKYLPMLFNEPKLDDINIKKMTFKYIADDNYDDFKDELTSIFEKNTYIQKYSHIKLQDFFDNIKCDFSEQQIRKYNDLISRKIDDKRKYDKKSDKIKKKITDFIINQILTKYYDNHKFVADKNNYNELKDFININTKYKMKITKLNNGSQQIKIFDNESKSIKISDIIKNNENIFIYGKIFDTIINKSNEIYNKNYKKNLNRVKEAVINKIIYSSEFKKFEHDYQIINLPEIDSNYSKIAKEKKDHEVNKRIGNVGLKYEAKILLSSYIIIMSRLDDRLTKLGIDIYNMRIYSGLEYEYDKISGEMDLIIVDDNDNIVVIGEIKSFIDGIQKAYGQLDRFSNLIKMNNYKNIEFTYEDIGLDELKLSKQEKEERKKTIQLNVHPELKEIVEKDIVVISTHKNNLIITEKKLSIINTTAIKGNLKVSSDNISYKLIYEESEDVWKESDVVLTYIEGSKYEFIIDKIFSIPNNVEIQIIRKTKSENNPYYYIILKDTKIYNIDEFKGSTKFIGDIIRLGEIIKLDENGKLIVDGESRPGHFDSISMRSIAILNTPCKKKSILDQILTKMENNFYVEDLVTRELFQKYKNKNNLLLLKNKIKDLRNFNRYEFIQNERILYGNIGKEY